MPIANVLGRRDGRALRAPVVRPETLAMGAGFIDTLGAALAVDVGAHWQPDDLFFEVCRDREAIGVMLAEVIGYDDPRSTLPEDVAALLDDALPV